LAAPGALMFRKNNDAFPRTTFRHLQYYVIGRGCLLEHNDLPSDRARGELGAYFLRAQPISYQHG
jgi:hypothetical protein